jgi:hypothetical protein
MLAATLAPAFCFADPSEGLWVGRVILNQVNEVVSAVDENNVRVQTPPDQTTPTSDQAEIQLILHVDGAGHARLLKSVAIVDGNSDPLVVNESLLTDPSQYASHPIARRIASVAFEFGDLGSRTVVGNVAAAAATAAAAAATTPDQAYADALAAAEAAIDAAASSGGLSSGLTSFVTGSDFQQSAATAATAARDGAAKKYAEGLRNDELTLAVRSEVLIGLQTLSQMGDGVGLNDLLLQGALAKGNTVTGEIFLGAYHPTNPFRHRRNPTHRGGYDITRKLKLTVANPAGGADFDTTERGIDRLTGIYEEEVFGLHKPLGQSGEFGLRTKGTFILDRISHDATLND